MQNSPLIQISVAALSNFVTQPKIRDFCVENSIFVLVRDLAEVYADSEDMQLDLIFLTYNCFRVLPTRQITLKMLPNFLPGIKFLARILSQMALLLPID